MSKRNFDKICCNPFGGEHKKIPKSKINDCRKISKEYAKKYQSLNLEEGKYICSTCRKNIPAHEDKNPELLEHESFNDNNSTSDDIDSTEIESCEVDTYLDKETELQVLNKSLSMIGESPIKKQKLDKGKYYAASKAKKIQGTLSKKLNLFSPSFEDTSQASTSNSGADSEMIMQFKEKFQNVNKRSEKLRILSSLPKSWSRCKIPKEFDVSQYMAKQAKKLVFEKGIMSIPNKRMPTFPSETVELIQDFYKSEEVSRIMPGKKDFKSVKKENTKVHEQKYLILCNLKEAYNLYKNKNPLIKVGFSKFAELRPKECIIAGGSGTHSVCVCTIHQNMKLMIAGSGLSSLTQEEQFHLQDYNSCLSAITCNRSTTSCFFNECSECEELFDSFVEYFKSIFHIGMIDDISYKRWISTDRTTLECITKPVEEFIDEFCNNLNTLKRHDFIAKQQSKFCTEKKESLNVGEILILGDFAENYSFLLQDAAQGFHWNNAQATLHPFVCYFKEDGELNHINVIVISDCLNHDTVAVHLFQKKVIQFLKTKISFQMIKITYFSDGAASQYKNYKNFINLCYHELDFQVKAEWHFFATSHGKGPCDGIGGTVKRLAAKASLQRVFNNQIMTPRQLYEFGKENIEGIDFIFSTIDEWSEEQSLLAERFSMASTIPGTQKLHSFVPRSLSELEVKFVSNMTNSRTVRASKQTSFSFDDIKGFVTAVYNEKWYLGCVLETYPESMEVKVTFLEPSGPSPSFKYPSKSDILTVPQSKILSMVDPRTITGRTYQLSEKESDKACRLLNVKLNS